LTPAYTQFSSADESSVIVGQIASPVSQKAVLDLIGL
jgi:hypothetical protein